MMAADDGLVPPVVGWKVLVPTPAFTCAPPAANALLVVTEFGGDDRRQEQFAGLGGSA